MPSRITRNDIEHFYESIGYRKNDYSRREWEFILYDTMVVSVEGLVLNASETSLFHPDFVVLMGEGKCRGFQSNDDGNTIWEKKFSKPGEVIFINRTNGFYRDIHLDFSERSTVYVVGYNSYFNLNQKSKSKRRINNEDQK